MRDLLFIILLSATMFVAEIVGYKYGWWKNQLFYSLFFFIGVIFVFSPIFPYNDSNVFMKVFFSLIFGVFCVQGHYILVKYLYQKTGDDKMR